MQKVSRALPQLSLPATHEVSSIITFVLHPLKDTGEVTAEPTLHRVIAATSHEQDVPRGWVMGLKIFIWNRLSGQTPPHFLLQ